MCNCKHEIEPSFYLLNSDLIYWSTSFSSLCYALLYNWSTHLYSLSIQNEIDSFLLSSWQIFFPSHFKFELTYQVECYQEARWVFGSRDKQPLHLIFQQGGNWRTIWHPYTCLSLLSHFAWFSMPFVMALSFFSLWLITKPPHLGALF